MWENSCISTLGFKGLLRKIGLATCYTLPCKIEDREQDINHFSKFAKITGPNIGWMTMV